MPAAAWLGSSSLQPRGPLRNDRLRHQAIEVGAKRRAAVARRAGARPSRRSRRPARARDRRCRARRPPASSWPASIPVVRAAPLPCGRRCARRVSARALATAAPARADRGPSPTSRARARAPTGAERDRAVERPARRAPPPRPKRSSRYSASARPTVSSTRSRESSGAGRPRAAPRVPRSRSSAIGSLPVTLELDPAEDDAGAVRRAPDCVTRVARRLLGRVVLPGVIEPPRLGQRIGVALPVRPLSGDQDAPGSQRDAWPDGSTRQRLP